MPVTYQGNFIADWSADLSGKTRCGYSHCFAVDAAARGAGGGTLSPIGARRLLGARKGCQIIESISHTIVRHVDLALTQNRARTRRERNLQVGNFCKIKSENRNCLIAGDRPVHLNKKTIICFCKSYPLSTHLLQAVSFLIVIFHSFIFFLRINTNTILIS